MEGLGVMFCKLYGSSNADVSEFVGKTIASAEINDNALFLTFEDGVKIKITDDGQSCCESRYMSCDDDLSSLVGEKLQRLELKNGPDVDTDYDCHEQQFLEVGTDKGFVTIVKHNEHNGYYGGFALSLEKVAPDGQA